MGQEGRARTAKLQVLWLAAVLLLHATVPWHLQRHRPRALQSARATGHVQLCRNSIRLRRLARHNDGDHPERGVDGGQAVGDQYHRGPWQSGPIVGDPRAGRVHAARFDRGNLRHRLLRTE